MRYALVVTIAVLFVGFLGGVFLYGFLMNKAYVANEENSLNSAGISFTDIALESSDSQSFLRDLQTYRKFKFMLTYSTSCGSIPLTCRDFVLNVKIEDLEMGSTRLDDFLMQTGSQVRTETCLLDLSHVSTNNLSYVQSKFYTYREELRVEVQGSATINASAKTKNVNAQVSKYFLLDSPWIYLGNVYWEKASASLGETVSFHVGFSNPYRATRINGTLTVDVMNDWGYGKETLYKTYTHSVSLNATQSEDYVEPCTLPTTDWDRWATIYKGWFLKVYWNGMLFYVMSLDNRELKHAY